MSKIKGIIRKGQYFDSVSLMIVSREIQKIQGISESSIIMATEENKSILRTAGLFTDTFTQTSESDLLIAIRGVSDAAIENAISQIESIFSSLRSKKSDSLEFVPKSIEGAIKQLPGANIALISVAGKYAAREAIKALDNNLHVMIFSDNVSIEDEKSLKIAGKEKGLLVMGPDCGTAIINGTPLAFSNVVSKGDIGIVAASGTGLQEVSSIITNNGCGISQAIGTGGRDVKKEIGGIMFIEALIALNADPSTKVIVLVSKPPHEEVLLKISHEIKKITKPVVAIFIGGNQEIIKNAGAIPAQTLEEAALLATGISKGFSPEKSVESIKNAMKKINEIAEKESKNKKAGYIRGLFSGGTLCDETQLILKDYLGFTYSNTPLNKDYLLKNIQVSEKHTIVDMGDDDFTVGKPHPMIDFSQRNQRILKESKDPETSVILLDVVLGYGSNMNPSEELVPVITEIKKQNSGITIICSITGTDKDPQNRKATGDALQNAGAIVMPSNASASHLAAIIIKKTGGTA